MPGPTSSNRANLVNNLSCYITIGGAELGLVSEKVKLKFPAKIGRQQFAHSQSDYSVYTDKDSMEISGSIAEPTHANLLMLLSGTEAADAGNSIMHSGEFGVELTTQEIYVVFYHDKSFFKRIHLPVASIGISGDLDIGSDATTFLGQFTITAQSGGDYLYKVLHTADSSNMTITPSPADAAVGVTAGATVTLTFSQAVGTAFQETASHRIRMIKKETLADAITSISWNAAGTVATLAHASFTSAKEYLILVDRDVRAAVGVNLRGDGVTDNTDFISDFTVA